MPEDRLRNYRGKRRPGRTPEPVPAEGPLPSGRDDTFVVQEHHARALHWDLRLERDGVLVSWAVPKGLPPDPATNHLAVHTEDHPLEYAAFEGEIPRGEYGGGTMTIWDRGTYETERWTDREVKIMLNGTRVSGRYALFRTDGRNWMIHRMDPPDPGWAPPPELAPMTPATRARLPRDLTGHAVEFAWGGRRALAYVGGGRLTLRSPSFADITADHRWLRPIGRALGGRAVVLDGELVRMGGADVYVCYDVLYDDGRAVFGEPYERRRAVLEELELAGPHWQTSPAWPGREAPAVRRVARDRGLAGVVVKRLDAPYEPGAESAAWVLVPGGR